MLKKPFAIAAFLVGAVMTAGMAQAQGTRVVEKFGDWVLYAHSGDPAEICFLTAQAKETKPVGYKKERSYFYVSAWPKDGVKAEISVNIGRNLQNKSQVTVQIGSARYALFTKGNKAFVEDPTQELKLIDSMKRGSFMVVRATTDDGTQVSDTYSLIGVTKAVNTLSRRGCS